MAPFVNGFVIDGLLGDNILIATTESVIIFDKYYERQATIKYDSIFEGFTKNANTNLCCVSGFEKDGHDFLFSFTCGDSIKLLKEAKEGINDEINSEREPIKTFKH